MNFLRSLIFNVQGCDFDISPPTEFIENSTAKVYINYRNQFGHDSHLQGVWIDGHTLFSGVIN